MRQLLGVISVALMLHSSVLAVSPQEMLGNLKDQLYQALAVKQLDDTSITTFVMALPGIPLDPDIDLTQPDDLRALYSLLNFVPTGDITGQNSSDKMSDIYLRILDGSKNLVENPKKPQLQAQADLIEQQWGKLYDDYFQYRGDYLKAQAIANTARAHNDPQKAVLQNQADQAKVAWELNTKGHKTQYEQLRNQWRQLLFDIEGGEPWAARRQKYDEADNAGFPVFTWPKYSSWQKDNGWMKVSFSSSNLQSSQHQSTVQWGGSGGFFGFGARAGGSTSVDVSQETIDKLSIVFEVKRVLIDRQWLDASVFRSKKWTWKDPAELPISFGAFNKQKHIFEGRMPLLPTSVILIRKVVLSSNWGQTVAKDLKTGIQAAGGWSFGPFSIGGNYGNSSHDASKNVKITDAGIEIPDPQIIGWMCDILPKSPNQ